MHGLDKGQRRGYLLDGYIEMRELLLSDCCWIYIQMEEKAVDEKATSRRSRKDEEGRDFQCGCGKRYLSYPALYTHIKTKHDGRQPQGTLKTGTTQLTKRGKNKMEEELLKSICSFFSKEELKVLSEMEEASGSVPLNSRIRKENLPKETYQCFQGIMKEKEVKLLPNSSLDLALTVYLINVGFYVNEKVYEHFLAFARTARTCFNDFGQEVYRAYFSRREQGGPFFLPTYGNQVRFFPIIGDFLLQCYLPQSEARDLNFSLIQLILFDFCSWLSNRKLTQIRSALPQDYQLDYRPQGKHRTPSKQEHPAENNDKEHREDNEDQSEDISENQPLQEDEAQQRGRDKEPSEAE